MPTTTTRAALTSGDDFKGYGRFFFEKVFGGGDCIPLTIELPFIDVGDI